MLFKELNFLADGRIGYSFSENAKDGESLNDFSSKCVDPPSESFEKAINDLIPIFLNLCEIPENDIKLYEFKSIKFTRTGDEQVLGVHITCFKRLSSSLTSIKIESPLKFCGKANSNTESYQIFDNNQKEIIYTALKECELYAKGDRLQIVAEI